jgi:predicted NBD/HSP70 family sugar kinase
MPDLSHDEIAGLAGHGAGRLPAVQIDAYNAELRHADGFIGDRASKRAFLAILDETRDQVRGMDDTDPVSDRPSNKISRKTLDRLLVDGDPEAAGVVLGSVEEFAQEFAAVIRRLLRLKAWRDTERIVVGGGFRGSRVGELAIGRALGLLKARGISLQMQPIRHDPDEAGLIGSIHLAPSWVFSGHDAILAVDIGGTNIRAGIVDLQASKAPDLSAARVTGCELWRHADHEPTRDAAVARLVGMLRRLMKQAGKDGLNLAPFIGIGCPGVIGEDGSIERGGQNLPGNWEGAGFNLPRSIQHAIPEIGDHETVVLIHNDAVVQGLSEVPFMRDVTRWGVLTIGTGLGNARFTNRKPATD